MTDLIEEFLAATEHFPSPKIFRRWAALGLVSALMSRRVWTSIGSGLLLYPNLFTFLVGDPASGKSLPIDEVKKIIAQVPELSRHVAVSPDEATPPEIVKLMVPKFMGIGSVEGAESDEGQWSYNAIISEIGNFMPTPDIAFMQKLARFWDCPDKWEKGTIYKGEWPLHKPYFTFLAGAQPAWINLLMSQDIVGLGLPSRVMFVGTSDRKEFVPFLPPPSTDLRDSILATVPSVVRMAGFAPFTKEAQELYIDWWRKGKPSGDGHPFVGSGQLEHYADRRKLHIGKLALLYAGSRHPDVAKVLPEDLQSAFDTIFEAEKSLPKVIAAFGGNPYRMREDAVVKKLGLEYKRLGRAITEAEVRNWINLSIPDQHEGMVLEGMIARAAIISSGKAPLRLFKPGAVL